MLVGIKDSLKMIGIVIVACCAVFVCTLFLNFNLDIASIQNEIVTEQTKIFYDAQVAVSKATVGITGGCLMATSIVMLLFYIKHFIDTHKKELGILKALGYSNFRIAKSFWIFGTSVFAGAFAGFCGAWLFMPTFYAMQNADSILPKIDVAFHFPLLLCLVGVPAIVFSILAVSYGCVKLRTSTLDLLKNRVKTTTKKMKSKQNKKEEDFLKGLKKNVLRERKTLVFFIGFAAFCFSAMTQMSFSMNELASAVMGVMIMIIGIILACTTLLMAVTTVVDGNKKTIAMMRVLGYSQKQCCDSLLGAYRPIGYVGFAIGTVYQYALLKIMVSVVFKNVADVGEYNFDLLAMVISLIAFIFAYELVMFFYSQKIKKASVKAIMIE